MDMNPGFELLKKAFESVAEKYNPAEIKEKVVKSIATGGQALVDKALEEFPKENIEEFINDVYSFVGSRDVADGISLTAQSVTPEDIQGALDQFTQTLASDEVATKLAQQLKQIAEQDGGLEGITGLIESQTEDMPLPQQMMVKMLLQQVEPMLEQVKDMSEPEVAEMIKQGVDAIPTDMIAMQVYSIAQNVTPERVSAVAQNITGNLPSAETVSEVIHGVAGAAKKQLGRAADPANADAPASATEFAQEAEEIVSKAVQSDSSKKKTIDKNKGIDFDF